VQGRRGLDKLYNWGKGAKSMVGHMYSKDELQSYQEKFLQDPQLALYAPLILAHQWVALDRKTAEFAVAHMEEILEGVQTIMERIGGPRQQGGAAAKRWLDLAPDECWLIVLAKLWREKNGQDWLRYHSVSNVGTMVVFPPNAEQGARLEVGLGLAAAVQGGPEPLEVGERQAGVTDAHCMQAWGNTAKVTKWQYENPITWWACQQHMLWVVGGEDGDVVVCGSLATMIAKLKKLNHDAFQGKSDEDISFMLRKVGCMAREDAEWFSTTTRERLLLP
jgi:hypothetical protein